MYVRKHGPEHVTDEELLRRSTANEQELQLTVLELGREASKLERRMSEREEARSVVTAAE